jgi:hypothetical protein
VQRAWDPAVDYSEVARNQKHDIIEIGVVVDTGHPRWIWGASMGSGDQAEHRDQRYNGDEPVPTYVLRHRLTYHPLDKEGRELAELYPDYRFRVNQTRHTEDCPRSGARQPSAPSSAR